MIIICVCINCMVMQAEVRMIKKGVVQPGGQLSATTQGKPWKKHNNRNKKEKTRRTQAAVVY